MKNLFFGFLFAVLVSGVQATAQCLPQTHTHTLSDGTAVRLPICYQHAKMYAIMGEADLGAVAQEIAGARVVPVSVGGKAQVMLTVSEFPASSVGAYKEALLSVFASRTPRFFGFLDLLRAIRNPLFGPSTEVGSFAVKLWVTEQIPLLAGNEIWGLNKTRANIEVPFSRSALRFVVTDTQGTNHRSEEVFSFRWQSLPNSRVPAQGLSVYSISPGNSFAKQSWFLSPTVGRSYQSAWNGSQDSLSINRDTLWGAWINRVRFVPKKKSYSEAEFSLGVPRRDL